MVIFKLASRNIWRNRRRTFITAGAIMFAVFFAVAMQSVQKGIFNNMEEGMINSFVGFAQIHSNGFWDDQSLDYAFPVTEQMDKIPAEYKEINDLVPRLESFALASHLSATRGALIMGIHPEKEDALTAVSSKLVAGDYLKNEDDGVLMAAGLAEYLGLKLGDTLILTSQGYHGVNAAGAYPIKGLLKFPSPELNKQMVYLSLPAAQHFFAADGLVTSLVVNTNEPQKIKETVAKLSKELGETYEVMSFEKLIPDLIQARQFKEAGSLFMLFILYAIITFGIFGTILMMIKERQYEFGVLTAIGLKTTSLSLMIWLEVVFMGLIGVLGGVLIAAPMVYMLNANPVKLTGEAAAAYEEFGIEPLIMASTEPSIFINQAITVFIIVTILAIYPTLKILKLKPVEAMRN